MQEFNKNLIKREAERLKEQNKSWIVDELKSLLYDFEYEVSKFVIKANELEKKLIEENEPIFLYLLRYMAFSVYVQHGIKLDKAILYAFECISFFSQETYYGYISLNCLYINLIDIYLKKDPELMGEIYFKTLQNLQKNLIDSRCIDCIKYRFGNYAVVSGDYELYSNNTYNDFSIENKLSLVRIYIKNNKFEKAMKIIESINENEQNNNIEFQNLYAELLNIEGSFKSALNYNKNAEYLINEDTPRNLVGEIFFLQSIIYGNLNKVSEELNSIERSYQIIRDHGLDRMEYKVLELLIKVKNKLKINSLSEEKEFEALKIKFEENKKILKNILT